MVGHKTVQNGIGEVEQGYVIGRYGFSGSHSHLVEVTFRVEDADKPWAKRKVISARPMCAGITRGDKHAHSLNWTAPVNTKTITCEKCREFRCVEPE